MTDGFDDRPRDDSPDGPSGEASDAGAGPDNSRTDPNGDGTGPGDDEEYEPSLAGVFGGPREDEPTREELVPETPTLENALFLLLGVLLGTFVIYRAVTVFTA